jgi:hypothetical protein
MILKADGSTEAFDPERLYTSLLRAGAKKNAAESIATVVAETIAPGATSHDVYARAFAMLRKEARPIAARYGLRRALLEFGPSGHPFEDFVSHLYTKEGWVVETRKMIQGKCVMHETDFYASHPERKEYMAAELKYHNDASYKSDLKTALYVKSRFDDIFNCDSESRSCPLDRGILITNTKFTSEAVRYAECAGVELLGWSYPTHDNLFERMSKARVYPVTTLTTLAKSEKRLLVDGGIIAVDQLVEVPAAREALRALRMSPEHIGEIIAEAEALLALAHLSNI